MLRASDEKKSVLTFSCPVSDYSVTGIVTRTQVLQCINCMVFQGGYTPRIFCCNLSYNFVWPKFQKKLPDG